MKETHDDAGSLLHLALLQLIIPLPLTRPRNLHKREPFNSTPASPNSVSRQPTACEAKEGSEEDGCCAGC